MTPTTEFRTTCLGHELESASGCGTTLECNCKQKKFNYQILIRVLRWVVPIFFFFLIFQWVVIISSTVPSGDMVDFQHALIIDMDGRPGLRLQKGLLLLRADRLLAGGGLVGLAWRGIFFFDTKSD